MNATMVASGTKGVPPVVSSIQDIPLGKIRESKTNPRRFFDEAKLAELADFVPGNKIRVMWRNLLWRSDLSLLRWVTGNYARFSFHATLLFGLIADDTAVLPGVAPATLCMPT